MSLQTKTKQISKLKKLNTFKKPEVIRIVVDKNLEPYILAKKSEYPLLNTVDIVKMLLSKGLVVEQKKGFALASSVLKDKQINNTFLNISQDQEEKLLSKLG